MEVEIVATMTKKNENTLGIFDSTLVAAIVATLWFGPSWDLLLVSCMMSYLISWLLELVQS